MTTSLVIALSWLWSEIHFLYGLDQCLIDPNMSIPYVMLNESSIQKVNLIDIVFLLEVMRGKSLCVVLQVLMVLLKKLSK